MFIYEQFAKISLGTTNDRRLALARGFYYPLCHSKGVLPMTVNELIGLLGALASFFGLGYMIGSDKVKKIIALVLEKLGDYLL